MEKEETTVVVDSKHVEVCEEPENLMSDSIYTVIERANYGPEIPNYLCNPVIGKASCWEPLGTKISNGEKSSPAKIAPEQYFTIRLDGKNFSSTVPKLKNMGIFSEGYSTEFENIMKSVAEYAATIFPGALYVFTQSDEITIVYDKVHVPENAKNPSHFVHVHSGRKDKLLSLASAKVSTKFLKELMKLVVTKTVDDSLLSNKIDELPDIVFDARIGVYSSLPEAFELVLWRSYDCSVNGISQALFFAKIPGAKKASNAKSNEKLEFLMNHNLFPLSDHQAYGSFYRMKKVEIVSENYHTHQTEVKLKKVYELVPGPVIRNFKEGLFPEVLADR